jgi:CBS domain containing-hemolysin-like protein
VTTVDVWLLVAVVAILGVLTALALAEMSLSRITKQKAEALVADGHRAGRWIMRLASEPTRWVNPLLLTVNILQTVQATLTGVVAGRLFGPAGVAVGVAANVVVFFVLAEAVPKTYAVLNPVRGAAMTARLVDLLVGFWPLRMASGGLIRLTNLIVRGKGLAEGPFVSEQEFLGIVEAAAKESVIEHEERELIESVIEFGDTVVREIMVPRPDMVTIEDDLDVTRALDVAVRHRVSRLPVLRADDDERDDLEGMVYTKDLIALERAGKGADPVRSHLRDVEVVPETRLVSELMRRMQSEKFHLALVANEYGDITGLVTLEDCLEELVGEITDEHDEDDTSVRVQDGVVLVTGSTTVDRLNESLEAFGPPVAETEHDTVGGLVFGTLGYVPEPGEGVVRGGWRFTVEQMDGRRIQLVRVRRAT